jgi:TrmH family RNA methyltransferase
MNIRKIESRDNPRLKLARKVRDGLEREFIFIEGTRLAEEAVRSGLMIEIGIFENGYGSEMGNNDLIETISGKTNEIIEVGEQLFSTISDTRSSQGIVLICKRPMADRSVFEKTAADRSAFLPLVVMLHEINNPSNLGAVIRTSEAAGATGVITSINSADVFSPRSLRGAMGSTFRMPIWAGAQLVDILDWSRSKGFSTVGASADANRSYAEVDWTAPHLLFMGSEAHGIPTNLEGKLDRMVSIPMDGNVESLNLAVAAGIILFEARRQVSAIARG